MTTQSVKIKALPEGSNVKIKMIQVNKNRVEQKDPPHLIHRLAIGFLENGGNYQEWVNYCRAVMLMVGIEYYGNQTKAAEVWGMQRSHICTLAKKYKELGV